MNRPLPSTRIKPSLSTFHGPFVYPLISTPPKSRSGRIGAQGNPEHRQEEFRISFRVLPLCFARLQHFHAVWSVSLDPVFADIANQDAVSFCFFIKVSCR